MSIAANLLKIKNTIPNGVTLVAVTKTKPVADILEAYTSGHKIFGENKVQELVSKQPELPADTEWHHIGHLQTNKVKFIAPFVTLIHAVDSLKLLKEINKEGLKNKRVIDCLLQVHIAKEETKFGLDFSEAEELILSPALSELKNIRIRGLMGMATNTNDENVVRNEFRSLKTFFEKLKATLSSPIASESFNILSMGMSSDYQIAIEEGSNMIRVGSAIFGGR